jgi:hypothetical protein
VRVVLNGEGTTRHELMCVNGYLLGSMAVMCVRLDLVELAGVEVARFSRS